MKKSAKALKTTLPVVNKNVKSPDKPECYPKTQAAARKNTKPSHNRHESHTDKITQQSETSGTQKITERSKSTNRPTNINSSQKKVQPLKVQKRNSISDESVSAKKSGIKDGQRAPNNKTTSQRKVQPPEVQRKNALDNNLLAKKPGAKPGQRTPKNATRRHTQNKVLDVKPKSKKIETFKSEIPRIDPEENWRKLLEKLTREKKLDTDGTDKNPSEEASNEPMNTQDSKPRLKRKTQNSAEQVAIVKRRKIKSQDQKPVIKQEEKGSAPVRFTKTEQSDNKVVVGDDLINQPVKTEKDDEPTEDLVARDKAILDSMFGEKQPSTTINKSGSSKISQIWFDDVDDLLIGESTDNTTTTGAYRQFTVTDPSSKRVTQCLAIDCEMVEVKKEKRPELVLARVSLVNRNGQCIFDTYVTPTGPVVDYRTAFSGVTEDILNRFGRDFATVQKEITQLVRDRTLIGHAVHNDLKVLQLKHPPRLIRDTQTYPKFIEICGMSRPSLKLLAHKFLSLSIQTGSHSSIVDAQTCMRLYTLVRNDWELQQQATRDGQKVTNKNHRSKGQTKKKRVPQSTAATKAISLPLD